MSCLMAFTDYYSYYRSWRLWFIMAPEHYNF